MGPSKYARFRLLAFLFVAALVAAGCGQGGASPSTSVRSSTSAEASGPVAVDPAASVDAPTRVDSASIDPSTDPTPGVPSTPGPTRSAVAPPPSGASALDVWATDPPTDSERAVLAHIPNGIYGACISTEQRWLDEVDAVYCYNDTFEVTYGLFRSTDAMQTAYDLDITAITPQPTSTGDCAGAEFEDGYARSGRTGRLLCSQYDDFGTVTRFMEWTDERTAMIGYLSSTKASWADLIAFWERSAAPR